MTRIVSWNIQQGGGARASAVARSLEDWAPDVVGLCEFRGSPPSSSVRSAIKERGLSHTLSTSSREHRRRNAQLVAAKWPCEPAEFVAPPVAGERWLPVRVSAPDPFVVIQVHIPGRSSGLKDQFFEAVIEALRGAGSEPTLLVGDMNTGHPGMDEAVPFFNAKEQSFLEDLVRMGWTDAYRARYPKERTYSWFSTTGNGFRLDQVYANPAMVPRIKDVTYMWGGAGPADLPSDHAAVVVDLHR